LSKLKRFFWNSVVVDHCSFLLVISIANCHFELHGELLAVSRLAVLSCVQCADLFSVFCLYNIIFVSVRQ